MLFQTIILLTNENGINSIKILLNIYEQIKKEITL